VVSIGASEAATSARVLGTRTERRPARHGNLAAAQQLGDVTSAAPLMSRHIMSWKPQFIAALKSAIP